MNKKHLVWLFAGIFLTSQMLKPDSVAVQTDLPFDVSRATSMGIHDYSLKSVKAHRSRWAAYLGRFLLRKSDLYSIGTKHYMALLAFMDRIEAGKADPKKPKTSTFNRAARQIAVGEAESTANGSKNFEGSGFEVPLKARHFAYGRLSILFNLLCSLEDCSQELKDETKAMKIIAKRMLMAASIKERVMASVEGYGSKLFWAFGAATCLAIIGGILYIKDDVKKILTRVNITAERIQAVGDKAFGAKNERLDEVLEGIVEAFKKVGSTAGNVNEITAEVKRQLIANGLSEITAETIAAAITKGGGIKRMIKGPASSTHSSGPVEPEHSEQAKVTQEIATGVITALRDQGILDLIRTDGVASILMGQSNLQQAQPALASQIPSRGSVAASAIGAGLGFMAGGPGGALAGAAASGYIAGKLSEQPPPPPPVAVTAASGSAT